ncbi:zinc-ribbon domain-containing protein [Rummeliibacillus pycnus]|uniref:zinc-ribbon domain-containing protein n=1 Tax=Rummeliibacillus pycnus TaxID=101070 RepID=UPI000C9AED11|nr:zinc-ribbon domain-containing protein [Rummeliibacillus pycnus]
MCKFDPAIKLKDNAMLKIRPELFDEWDFEENNKLGFDIYKMTKGSHKVVWWNCNECVSKYNKKISDRIKGQNCPYCSGSRINETNSLASLNPELASEWHPTLNGKLTPKDVTSKKSEKVWWLGSCGHEWDARIDGRSNGNGCPICDNKIILKGFNDMWTTNPKLSSLLLNPEDGYKYSQTSGRKVNWKCSECESIIRNKKIADINYYGIKCPKCSDGFSIPERIMYNLLMQLNIDFNHDVSFKWSNTKRYDFYIPLINLIIETHGGQHSERGFKSIGGRSLDEEIANDKLKEKLAKGNDIENYIVIDTRLSEFDYIKTNILNSKLSLFLDLNNVDWIKIFTDSQKSLSKIAYELWNDGLKDVVLIANKLNIHKRTVWRYLEFWSSLGKCDDFIDYNDQKRKVVQLSPDNVLIKVWMSISDAVKKSGLTITTGNISKVCKGQRNKTGECKWMYLNDYEKFVSTGIPPYPLDKDHPNSKAVVKLNNNLELIEKYSSIKKAAKNNNIKSVGAIANACLGKSNSSGGYKWMYLDDYEKMLKDE